MTTTTNAAEALEGRVLKNGWTVMKRIEKPVGSTGGFFSVCYVVEKDSKPAFLKALNFHAFFQMFRGRPIVEILQEQTEAFQYERELLLRCKNGRLSKVAMIIDEGEEIVDGYTIPNVPYLIFESAEGDVRSKITFAKDVETAWKLRSLHNVAVGLQQLHKVEIGHQDLKPSNVLLYDKGVVSKLGDLGRSLCKTVNAPHDNGVDFPGDFTYAPTEFLYGYIEPEWNKRVHATDMYLFGSLIVFYFLGTNMTALIGSRLDPQFRWNSWTGTFEDVKDYLVQAFYSAIKDFNAGIGNPNLAKELGLLLEYTCFPYPNKRGHPASINTANQYNWQQIITRLDILANKAQMKFF